MFIHENVKIIQSSNAAFLKSKYKYKIDNFKMVTISFKKAD